ncbi:MAG: hypothetical protein WCG85_10100 [Polyangia bacterium]
MSVAGPRPDGELFADMVEADVVVAVAAAMPAMALVAVILHQQDISSLPYSSVLS